MLAYIVRRVLLLIPTLLGIVFIIFTIMDLTPGSPAEIILGQEATVEGIEKLNHELGYDKPYIVRYANYVIDLFHGDMGNSYRSRRPVFQEIMLRFPTTVKLAFSAMTLSALLGVTLGVLSAVKQYSIGDIIGTVSAMLLASMPPFWLAMMSVLFFSLKLGWLPSTGSSTWMHYILPSIALAIPGASVLLRLTRTNMLETIRQDYVRTAHAKGQRESKIIFRHALKNALLPVVTVIGMDFGAHLGGTIVIEQVFSINGVGTLLVDAIRMKDVPQVTGCALLLALFFMIIMLIVDILYAYIDPRLRARYKSKGRKLSPIFRRRGRVK